MKVFSFIAIGIMAVACVSSKAEVKPVSTPTATPEPDVPGLVGWTEANVRQEMGQCMTIIREQNLCACLVGTVAAELTFKDFNNAKLNQPRELQAALVEVVKHCQALIPQTI